MNGEKGTMIFEASPPGKSAPVLLTIFGVMGMMLNFILLAQGNNFPILGTICGLMLCAALVFRLYLPRRYELSDRKITLVYHGRQESIDWEDVDLILSMNRMRSRDGRKIPLVKVESGQHEFNAFLVRKLRDQLSFETDWHLRNWEHDDSRGTFERQTQGVVTLALIGIIGYVVQDAVGGDNWAVLFQLVMPFTAFYALMVYGKNRIGSDGVKQDKDIVPTEDITAILVDMDGMKYKISVKHLKGTLVIEKPLFEAAVALRALAYWNPNKPMTCELHSITGVTIEPEVIRALVTP